MKKIKSDETKPEIIFRKTLWAHGIRYRKNTASLPGKPDIVIARHKIVIFVDGEFWHGYRWEEKKKKIRANRRYWIPKIEKTIKRDKRNARKLRRMGWSVLRFWQHRVEKDIKGCIEKVERAIARRDGIQA